MTQWITVTFEDRGEASSSLHNPDTFTLSFQPSDTVYDVVQKVSQVRRYVPSSFDLVVSHVDEASHAVFFERMTQQTTLAELRISELRGPVIIERKPHFETQALVMHGPQLPKHMYGYDFVDDDIYGGAGYGSYPPHRVSMGAGRNTAWNQRSRTGSVTLNTKLKATYFPSVVQTLYNYTPFRLFVYKWPFEKWMQGFQDTGLNFLTRLQGSVMFQLQLLFAKMQMLEVRSVSTRDLCEALQWDKLEQCRTHEVDAFLRHLYACIEKECALEPVLVEELDRLVRWTVRSTNRCRECKAEVTAREDTQVDLGVELMQMFGDAAPERRQCIQDLVEGLDRFFAPLEIPMVKCAHCACEVAVQTREVLKVPQLMMIRLERFVFMPEMDRRSKIREEVRVPQRLQLNKVMPSNTGADVQLDLYSAFLHHGSSLDGVFSTVVRLSSNSADGSSKWVKFIDPEVEELYNMSLMMEQINGAVRSEADDSAYMVAYVRSDSAKPVPTLQHISKFVADQVNEYHQTQLEKKRKKQQEREQIMVRVLYEARVEELRVPGSTRFGELEELAAAKFGVQVPRDRYRLRRWDNHHQIPRETFGSRINTVLSSLHFHGDSLRLEILDPHQDKFEEFDYNSLTVKVRLYESQRNDFSPVHIVTIPSRTDTLHAVKKAFGRRFGIPTSHVRLFKESMSHMPSDSGVTELIGEDDEFYKFSVWEGSVMYLEESDVGVAEDSPCMNELERRKNELKVIYRFADAERTVQIDRRKKIFDFKLFVAEQERVDVDSLVVYQLVQTHQVRCRNEEQALQEILCAASVHMQSTAEPARLVIGVKSAPEKDTVTLRIALWMPPGSANAPPGLLSGEALAKGTLLDLQVLTSTPVAQIKEQVSVKLLEMGLRHEGNALHFRLRELEAGELAGVVCAALPIKEAVTVLYSQKPLAVELIDGPDTRSPETILLFARRFFSDYTLSPIHEVVVRRTESLDDLRVRLSKIFAVDVGQVGLARSAGAVSPLDLPGLDWNPRLPAFLAHESKQEATVCGAPMYLHDGDLVIMRDESMPLATLSEEEVTKLKGLRHIF